MNIQNKAIISHVALDSIAEEVGIKKGDKILNINGHPLKDIIDYQILSENEKLMIEVEKKNGEIWEIDIEKNYYDPLGIAFEKECFDGLKKCRNNCVFCFIKGLPSDLRESLYVKDDDYRHSFLYGNYITLTNLNWDELKRINKLKLSPIYVSVHTTNPELRVKMIGNKNAGDLYEKLKYLADAGIKMHTQIVLVPGLNDGLELDKTIMDLISMWPAIQSLAVVPVGLTKYNYMKGEKLRSFSQSESFEVIKKVQTYQKQFLHKFGSRFVSASDEFFLKAGLDVPDDTEYEGFPQLENGVGLVRNFLTEFEEFITSGNYNDNKEELNKRVLIATGESAFPIINNLIRRYLLGHIATVYQVTNNFFGAPVSVTGLLTGQDLIKTLKNIVSNFDLLLISDVMLKDDLFLDNMKLKQVEEELGVKVNVVENSGFQLAKILTGGEMKNV